MPAALEVRATEPTDHVALSALYAEAFPEEDLRPLVQALLAELTGVVSLAAAADGALVGHLAVTLCGIGGAENAAALLGPLAVHPSHQRQGVGRALIEAGVARMHDTSARLILVLGDPAYYGRFGFETGHGVAAPYALPKEWEDAWRALPLKPGPAPAGSLNPPAPWRRPELWAP